MTEFLKTVVVCETNCENCLKRKVIGLNIFSSISKAFKAILIISLYKKCLKQNVTN